MKLWGVAAIILAIAFVPTFLGLLCYRTGPVSPETPQIVLPTHYEETVDDPTEEIVLDLQLWADQLRAHRESGEEGPAPLTITPLDQEGILASAIAQLQYLQDRAELSVEPNPQSAPSESRGGSHAG